MSIDSNVEIKIKNIMTMFNTSRNVSVCIQRLGWDSKTNVINKEEELSLSSNHTVIEMQTYYSVSRNDSNDPKYRKTEYKLIPDYKEYMHRNLENFWDPV